MADSTFVFPPGWYATDTDTRAPVSGAVIKFYDAGTTNPKTVYADKNLETAIGTSVTCDGLGYPTSDGETTKTLIYVGTSAYKIRGEDAAGNLLFEHDNVVGAVSVPDSSDVAVTAKFPVVTKSLDYTVLDTDQNTSFSGNCSSGDVAFTLPSATDDDIPSGWAIRIQHAGSANRVTIETVSSQTISEGSKSFGTQYVLTLNGEDVLIVSDGGNWRIFSHTVPFIKVAQGVIPVADRLSSPPASPNAGEFYILTSSPSGDWSSYAEHDLVFYTGAAWVKWTPYTDCGWIAYVQDEDKNYQFQGSAWVVESASLTKAGTIRGALKAEMESASTDVIAVTPGWQQWHPGHPKVWGLATVSSGVPTLAESYNMTSITDQATGDLLATFATDFSSTAYCVNASVESSFSGISGIVASSRGAGSVRIKCAGSDGTAADPSAWHFSALGDQ